jgi:rod shape-determining protein MreC
MAQGRRFARLLNLQLLLAYWPWLLLIVLFFGVRFSKGAPLNDLYALVTRPFWPGTAQAEWLREAQHLEDEQRISLLQGQLQKVQTDQRQRQEKGPWTTAAVISRRSEGWWQQLELGSGSIQGLRVGAVVTGPGGVMGRISSVSPSTARVTLLTDPNSKVGVELRGNRAQGLLVGEGTSRPRLRFLDKDVAVQPGDVVITSAASSIFPANLVVGVVQSVDSAAVPAPEALVQLAAPVEAIDWVRVR